LREAKTRLAPVLRDHGLHYHGDSVRRIHSGLVSPLL
jgi:hypothetical protein